MKKLYEYHRDVYSQNGEDGIIEHIFEKLGINGGVLLEIGAWDGFYLSNTANIWSKNKNFKSVLIESTDNLNVGELESKFEITELNWFERGILTSGGIVYKN